MSEIKNDLPHYIYRNTTSDNYGTDSVATNISQTTEGIEPRNYGAINFSAGSFTRTRSLNIRLLG
jgi:hypothetical protein